jgi:uncharacterized protein YggE
MPNFPIEFLARNTVRASVKRPDDVGKVIDAALGAGATSIASVQFSSPTTEEARGNALSMGVAQAQRDANILAKASGGTLGRLLSMSSSGGSPVMGAGFAGDIYYSVDREAGGTAFPTMINSRDLTVSVTVFGRWEFIPAPGR